MLAQSVIGSDDLEWVIIGLAGRKQRNSIELLPLEHLEFALKLDEFVIVGLAVEIALGNIIPEALELGHAVQNFACYLEHAILHL